MDYLLPLWLRQYLLQRQKREIPEDVADHLLSLCALVLDQRDPATLAQSRTHSIQQSFLIILQNTSSSRPSTTVRPKFPFSSTVSVFKQLTAQDLDPLNSQEIVRLAVYVMKRSKLEFADPVTSERVHTEGEKKPDGRSGAMGAASTAVAEVYLSKDFHIGSSVLHNKAYPLSRHVKSVLTLATFCARASGLRMRLKSNGSQASPTGSTATNLATAEASIAGAKWLAKMGQVMFGGPCSHAGHAHHRRTRASFELLERQSMELDQSVLKMSSPSSSSSARVGPVVAGHLVGPTSTVSSYSNANTHLNDKWCSHCSRAMSCLVITALKESSKGLRPEDLAAFEDFGFGTATTFTTAYTVIGVEILGINDKDSMSNSSTSSLGSGLAENRGQIEQQQHPHQRRDSRPRLEHKTDLNSMDPLARHQPSSPLIIFDRSHEHEGEMSDVATAGSDGSPLTTQPRTKSSLSDSLADALGSNIPPPLLSNTSSLSSSSSSRSNTRRASIVSGTDPNIRRTLGRPTNNSNSDLELVSRTASNNPSVPMSMESSMKSSSSSKASSSSWSDVNRPNPIHRTTSSPHPLKPTILSSSFKEQEDDDDVDDASDRRRPTTRLEQDLAEAVSTPSPVLGSVQSFTSVPAVTLGIQPSLGLVHEAVVSSSRLGSEASSSRGSLELHDEEIEKEKGLGDPTQSSSSQLESKSESVSAVPSSIPTSASSSSSSTPNSVTSSVDESQSLLGQSEDGDAPVEHHPFYALGIHGQASTDSYAREIGDSMHRTPPSDSGRSSSRRSFEGSEDENGEDVDVVKAERPTSSEGVQDESRSGEDDDHNDTVEAIRNDNDRRDHFVDKIESDTAETGSEEENSTPSSPPRPPSAPRSETTLPDVPADASVSSPPSSSPRVSSSPKSLSASGTVSGKEDEQKQEEDDKSDHQDDDRLSLESSTRPISSSISSLLSGSSLSIPHDNFHHHFRDLEDSEDEDDGDVIGDANEKDGDDDGNANHDPSSSSFLMSDSGSISSSSLDPTVHPLSRSQQEQQRRLLRRRKRRLLVDDSKRKQEQLDRIKAQLELKTLGKIREQVSFWEEKGVLEQKVVAMVEVDEDEEDEEKEKEIQSRTTDEEKENRSSLASSSSSDLLSSPLPPSSGDFKQDASFAHQSDLKTATTCIQPKADQALAEPISPGNNGHFPRQPDAPKNAPPRDPLGSSTKTTQKASAAVPEDDIDAFTSDVD